SGAHSRPWKPSTVVVQPGQRVRFRVANNGSIDHDLASDLAGMRETRLIPPGSELMAEWTAPSRPGPYEFWCAVPGHRKAGMTGTIVVK
ncbi:MAG: plastocyanin/azurin family copper-binding protein, partial [bacterium]